MFSCLTEPFLDSDPFSGVCEMPYFDFSPLGSSDFLVERSDGVDGLSLPLDSFICLSPPHSQDYHFGLEEHEGISELFDCDFSDFGPLEFWRKRLFPFLLSVPHLFAFQSRSVWQISKASLHPSDIRFSTRVLRALSFNLFIKRRSHLWSLSLIDFIVQLLLLWRF